MTPTSPDSKSPPPVFSSYQKLVVALLAFLQFTIVLDFTILSPMGPILMPQLGISARQFGLVVSAYAFSAGIAGILAAGFADKFDRKRLLLLFYAGFLVGTFLCGIAPNYPFLLGARVVAGLFGGVIGSISFAIVADLFPLQVRGRVMGTIQSAFAASQVMGIPIGLFLASHFGWRPRAASMWAPSATPPIQHGHQPTLPGRVRGHHVGGHRRLHAAALCQ
jgi:predicted MFS family arabinose efflux permease